jgi:hypothetical protein
LCRERARVRVKGRVHQWQGSERGAGCGTGGEHGGAGGPCAGAEREPENNRRQPVRDPHAAVPVRVAGGRIDQSAGDPGDLGRFEVRGQRDQCAHPLFERAQVRGRGRFGQERPGGPRADRDGFRPQFR